MMQVKMKKSSWKSTIILGVDPGTRLTGYGVVSYSCQEQVALDYGCIRPPGQSPLSQKYLIIFESLCELIEKYRPDTLVVETQFVHKNPLSAIKLGMARGMAVLAAAKHGLAIYEYPPKKAKLAVVGNGNASKYQVQKMTQHLLKLPCIPEPEDAADALSLALCHGHVIAKGYPIQGVQL